MDLSGNIGESRDSGVNTCPGCGRPNPASRPNCLYCSVTIPGAVVAPERSLEHAEDWEPGHNVVLSGDPDVEALRQVSDLLGLPEDMAPIIVAMPDLPVARLKDGLQAADLRERLTSLGFSARVVGDSDLRLSSENFRLGSIARSEQEVTLKRFADGKAYAFGTGLGYLFVEGMLETGKATSLAAGRKASAKVIEQESSNESYPVLDIYPAGHISGFRIVPSGFDFSCLGERKQLLVRDNWSSLLVLLQSHLAHSEFDRDYQRLRPWLDHVWPAAVSNSKSGAVKMGFGKTGYGTTVMTSNRQQFDRYSRLRHYLYEEKARRQS